MRRAAPETPLLPDWEKRRPKAKMRRVAIITALLMLLLALSATVAQAVIVRTINPANAPSGTHFQTGDANCAVGADGLSVSGTGFELAGVGNTNANVVF